MSKKILLVVCLSIFLPLSFVSGQGNTNVIPRDAVTESRIESNIHDRMGELGQLSTVQSPKIIRQKSVINRNPPPELIEELKKISALLAVNQDDKIKYQEFLTQPNTGLFRLLPNLGCNEKFVVNAGKECANYLSIFSDDYYSVQILTGDYYSFHNRTYAPNRDFDLTFKDDSFSSKSFLTQTIMVKLGDIALEDISLKSEGMKFLVDFVPQNKYPAAQLQYAEISKGISADGYFYANSEKAIFDRTYAVRLIPYRQHLDKRMISTLKKEDLLKAVIDGNERRTDLIVAFRVIRQDTDGSLSILWKELNKMPSPEVIFEKREPVLDFHK